MAFNPTNEPASVIPVGENVGIDPDRMRALLQEIVKFLDISVAQSVAPSASGTLAGRAAYDDRATPFIYINTEEDPPLKYYKLTSASGDWGPGTSDKGDKGDDGADANLEGVQFIQTLGYQIAFSDPDGNILLGVDDNGNIVGDGLNVYSLLGLPIEDHVDPDWGTVITDPEGNIIFGVTSAGVPVSSLVASEANATNQTIYYGWAEGHGDATKSLIFSWVSGRLDLGTVEYRVKGASSWNAVQSHWDREFPNVTSRFLHSALLDNLSPDTVYEIRWPGSTKTDSVKTPPRSGARVVVASDYQNYSFGSGSLLQLFGATTTALSPDLLVLNGDYVNDDGQFTATMGTRWYGFMEGVSINYRNNGALVPLLAGVGNHEASKTGDPGSAIAGGDGGLGMIKEIMSWGMDPELDDYFVTSASKLSIGKELFIISLETDHTVPLASQAAWFAAQLAENAPKHRNVLVFGHVPGFYGMADFEFDRIDTQARVLRNTIWPIMNTYADKIRCYICGHEHILSVTAKLKMNYDDQLSLVANDTRYTTDQTDGVRQLGAGPFGALRLGLDPTDMAEVSSIDASPKFIAAMGYDDVGDAYETHGTGITNPNKNTSHVWLLDFGATDFDAQAISEDGTVFYSISETVNGA